MFNSEALIRSICSVQKIAPVDGNVLDSLTEHLAKEVETRARELHESIEPFGPAVQHCLTIFAVGLMLVGRYLRFIDPRDKEELTRLFQEVTRVREELAPRDQDTVDQAIEPTLPLLSRLIPGKEKLTVWAQSAERRT
jgi:hypothetical protein